MRLYLAATLSVRGQQGSKSNLSVHFGKGKFGGLLSVSSMQSFPF